MTTEKKDLSFHLLHRKDGSRIKQRYFCASDDEPLELEDLARGYEVSPGRYVLMRDEDIDGIPISSLKSIDIAEFVQLSEVDPILFQRTYYLEPEEVGAKPYVLLRQALVDSGLVALGRFTLRRKEHVCLIRVVGDALSLTLLFNKDEVRPTEGLRSPDLSLVREAELAAAKEYIEALSSDFQHDKYSDPYRVALLAVIEAKAALQEQEPRAPTKSPSTLPDLLAALKAAVEETRAKKEQPVKKQKRLATADV